MTEAKQATEPQILRAQFMDHSIPLNEAGHWARRYIEALESPYVTKDMIGAAFDVLIKRGDVILSYRLLEDIFTAMHNSYLEGLK